MDKTILKASEIRYLWKHRGSKNYELKCLKATGNLITSIIFEDVRNNHEVSGKLVVSPREGEAYHWPRLQHENLAALFDVISINEKVSVYMSIVLERSLRDIIHENEFLQTPNCFQRKKSYAEDVLWGLDYLHTKRLFLMNLNDANVFIDGKTDKAIISDFSSLTLAARAMKSNFAVPLQYRAPELSNSSTKFNAVAAEMWACGVMLFQIFTGHVIPEASSIDEVQQTIANFHYGVLVEANRGSCITSNIFISLQNFLSLFLCLEPNERCTARTAAVSSFLLKSRSPSDRRYGKLWEYYDPLTTYSPEETAFKSKSFSDSPKILHCSYLKEVDSYRDNLKSHFPWNKFVNLNYVSNEKVSSDRNTFINSLVSNKQNDLEIPNNEFFDEQITRTKSFKLENAPIERRCTLEKIQIAKQSFENTNASEIIRNYFCAKKNTTHLSKLCPSDVPDPLHSQDNLPAKEISTTEFKQNEMQNEYSGLNNDSFINIIPGGNRNEIQKSDIEETNELSLNLSSSTDDSIVIQNEVKRSETFFINNECSESKCTNITQKNIVETTNKLSPSSSFSTENSIGTLESEIKWNNEAICCNVQSKFPKSVSDSDECTQSYESDFEVELDNEPVNERSKIEEEYNINLSSHLGKPLRMMPSFLHNPRMCDIQRFIFCKNRISELRRNHSDSTINSSVTQSVLTKSDPEINQYQSNSFKRESQTTVSSDASNVFLIKTTGKEFEKSINEVGMEPIPYTELEPCDILQNVPNFEMDKSHAKDSYRLLKRSLLLPSRSLTCHPNFSTDSNVPNRSDTSMLERKSDLLTTYKSETSLDIEKRSAMRQTKSFNKGSKLLKGDGIKFNTGMFNFENCLMNAAENIGYTSESYNVSFASEGVIFKEKLNECAMMEGLDLKSKYKLIRNDQFEGISRSDGKIGKQPISLAAGLNQIIDQEHEKSQGDIQYVTEISSEHVENEKSNESSTIILGQSKAGEINALRDKNSSFTEISLNSTQETDGKQGKMKIKKKRRNRKSWFYRLCPGSKVYHDDKEEFLTGN